ncbi:MAG: hypothetical protein O3A53_05875 [Acidobacteria bacterium]|nr:hypothetical protein [Acidobacteriota bacterium]
MAFPGFDEGKRKILFFSRGRGRGHAIPDMEIVKELTKDHEDVQVRFVSYGTGARTIEQYGFPLIDVGLPDQASHTAMTVIAGQLIGSLDPDLVVSHEEFAALPAAKIFNRRTVGITDWFVEPGQLSMACLGYADKILFIDEPGIFEEPPSVQGRVEYVGPILREFQYGPEDRGRARSELNIPSDAFVVAVLPGSWTEEKVPIFDAVMEAYDALDKPYKFLIWVAGSDHERLGTRLAGRQDVLVVEFDPVIERIMVAADVAVTKCTRKTHVELAALGTASVGLYGGLNSVDQVRVSKLATVLAPEAFTLDREYPRFAGRIQGSERPARRIAESCLALHAGQ